MHKALEMMMRFFLLILICVLVLLFSPKHAERCYASSVNVLISDSLRPYIEAADGLAGFLSDRDMEFRVKTLDEFRRGDHMGRSHIMDEKTHDFYVAIGPAALQAIGDRTLGLPFKIIYTMVVNPYQIVKEDKSLCGISLDIPADSQVDLISKSFPRVRRLGLLLDPAYNMAFFERASKHAAHTGIVLSPIMIREKKEIPSALSSRLDDLDAVWMIPDRTVISETVIEYVIKESLRRKKPVFGYNRFFYKSGSAAAFVFDYKEIGRQTGELLLDVARGAECKDRIPGFRFLVNPRVVKTIQLDLSEPLPEAAEMGP